MFQTKTPEIASIYKKTVATGAIVPRKEIDIKPRVSGVISELFVEAGTMVKKGQKLALIRIIPDVVQLNNAENRLKNAELNLKNSKLNLDRNSVLLENKTISKADFERIELNYELVLEEVEAAKNNLQLVREGALKGSSKSNNLVISTVDGMVLDVPIKEGTSVIESNSFNEGTTVMTIADMKDMVFEGFVDESEVGKINEGMELSIQVGAIEDEKFIGMLEYISPKGKVDQGTIQFEIKASVSLKPDAFIRAGYSANAEIVLEKKENILSIDEGLVLFEQGKNWVEVETEPQVFEKKEVELGLSDGLLVEVISGIDSSNHLKIQESYGKTYR